MQIYLGMSMTTLLWQSPCFLRSPKPLFQTEANCETIDLKMIFNSHANKMTLFHNNDFTRSLVLKVTVFGTRKRPWPICLSVDLAYYIPWLLVLQEQMSQTASCSCGFILIVMWRHPASDTMEWLADSDITFSFYRSRETLGPVLSTRRAQQRSTLEIHLAEIKGQKIARVTFK